MPKSISKRPSPNLRKFKAQTKKQRTSLLPRLQLSSKPTNWLREPSSLPRKKPQNPDNQDPMLDLNVRRLLKSFLNLLSNRSILTIPKLNVTILSTLLFVKMSLVKYLLLFLPVMSTSSALINLRTFCRTGLSQLKTLTLNLNYQTLRILMVVPLS